MSWGESQDATKVANVSTVEALTEKESKSSIPASDTKRIELEMLKLTARATKVAERTKRWFTRHPNSQRAQAQRFQQLAGVLSGSAASALASSSTTAGT